METEHDSHLESCSGIHEHRTQNTEKTLYVDSRGFTDKEQVTWPSILQGPKYIYQIGGRTHD